MLISLSVLSQSDPARFQALADDVELVEVRFQFDMVEAAQANDNQSNCYLFLGELDFIHDGTSLQNRKQKRHRCTRSPANDTYGV